MCTTTTPNPNEPSQEVRHCGLCSVEIPAARIEALPHTELCCSCSEDVGGETETVILEIAENGDVQTASRAKPWKK